MSNRVRVLPKDVEHGLIPILVVLVPALRPHRRRKRRGVAVIMGAVAVAGGGEQLKIVPAARVRPRGESCDRRPGEHIAWFPLGPMPCPPFNTIDHTRATRPAAGTPRPAHKAS